MERVRYSVMKISVYNIMLYYSHKHNKAWMRCTLKLFGKYRRMPWLKRIPLEGGLTQNIDDGCIQFWYKIGN